MKKILFTLLFIVACITGFTQLTNNGGAITVESGATLVIEGDYTSSNSGDIDIDGTVQLKGHFVNNSGTVNASSAGTLVFNGTTAQEIKGTQAGGTTFNCNVEIDNVAGVSLTSANQVLAKALTLTSGKLTLNGYDLTLAAVSTITGADATKYIVTSGAGQLKRPVAATNVSFPVGSASSYNPVILNNTTGTPDTYGVAFAATMPSGWTGTDHAVTGNWTISEGAALGSLLTVTPQWNLGQEQTNFTRTDCAVGVSADLGATVNWASSGAAGGVGPYYKDGAGFTSVGTFLVGDAFYLFINLDIDLFLAGPYNAGSMSTVLNSQIPLTDPYGNGTNATSIPATAVDWVEIELRSQGNPATVVGSFSGFVDVNGNLLAIDGTAGLKMSGVTKAQYYVAIRHRNHLGAMTLNPIDFTLAGPYAFDFSAGANIYGTNAMQNMGAKWALWAGNANGDNKIIYQGANNDPTFIGSVVINDPGNLNDELTYDEVYGYNEEDVNLDGYVIYQGANNDPTPIGSAIINYPANTNDELTFEIVEQIPN